MLTTKHKPATVGEILREEFMTPLGLNSRRARRRDGSSTQTCQRTLQRPAKRDRLDGAHSCARVRQQSGILAEHPAAYRSMGSDELSRRAQTDRARKTDRKSRLAPAIHQKRKAPAILAGAFACRTLWAAPTTPARPRRAAAPPRRARPRTPRRGRRSPWRADRGRRSRNTSSCIPSARRTARPSNCRRARWKC